MMSSTTSTWRPSSSAVEVLDDAHHARGLRGAAVGGHGHEVDVDRQLDGPAEVAHEDHGALEHADQQRRLVGVVGGDLRARARRPGSPGCGGVDQHGPHVGLGPGRDARSVLVAGHRRDITGAPRLDPETAARTAHPPAAGELGPTASPRRHGEDALDLGQRRRVVVGLLGVRTGADVAQPAAEGAPGQRPAGGGTRAHRRVGQRLGGQRLEQRHLVAQHPRLPGQHAGRGRGPPPRRTAAAARGGRGCARRRDRRWWGRTPARGPSAAHSAWVSRRRRPSSGWRWPGSMPARPSAPAPRSRLTRIVSAWSSMVCPVATSAGRTAKRAARARASRLGPGATDTRRRSKRAPTRAAASATTSASASEPARRPWSTWIGRDVAAGRGGQHEQGQRVGAARHRARQRRTRRREGAPGQEVGDEGRWVR